MKCVFVDTVLYLTLLAAELDHLSTEVKFEFDQLSASFILNFDDLEVVDLDEDF